MENKEHFNHKYDRSYALVPFHDIFCALTLFGDTIENNTYNLDIEFCVMKSVRVVNHVTLCCHDVTSILEHYDLGGCNSRMHMKDSEGVVCLQS